MKKFIYIACSLICLTIFIVFTYLVKNFDVQALGPTIDGVTKSVGFGNLNSWFLGAFTTKFVLYTITDIASIVTPPIGTIFFVMGIVQWVRRKNIFKVDGNILALGIFYVFMLTSFLLFQLDVVNYRPVPIKGKFESSYPSSTTMLSLTFFVGAIDQIKIYIKNDKLKWSLIGFCSVFELFLIIGRVISGVHWLTDIIGSIIISSALIFAYFGIKDLIFYLQDKADKKEKSMQKTL